LSHTATPNNSTAQPPVHQEIYRTEREIEPEGLGEALAECIQHPEAASSETHRSEVESDETDAVPTRRNTMASSSTSNSDTKKEATSRPPLRNLTPEQIQQMIGALTGAAVNTEIPRIKEPSTFHGEQDQLRGWLTQLSVYFNRVGCEFEYNNDKMVYTLSLLRGDALKGATPYMER